MNHDLPVLYSFRRCPYAMRARLAIRHANIKVELREIELRSKPAQMLEASPKGTVPVLVLGDGTVIDESLDIMLWALQQNDPGKWLQVNDFEALIQTNDSSFKYNLDRYKYAERYPEHPAGFYRQQGELFLAELESRLMRTQYLCGSYFSIADAAIAPFIRQFAAVDERVFQTLPYPALKRWLAAFLTLPLFDAVMSRYAAWKPGSSSVAFGYDAV
ncbi:glutathione S-transferase [Methylicorpusculum oleiharenae]|uniref:glutathione S-transferase n=1 Tax=Methylicorpusculum oleiharenae TaxID=1338687 RepID=UPI00135ACCD2|nr:glutathione S-transferase [Methylicorpusculum oleiharenae]MCD2449419.1 glutathione S-transferase [Methylicorpusculum oleiharenae]